MRARRALAHANLTGPGLVTTITQRVASLQIEEQRAFIGKIASLLSVSILSPPPQATSSGHKLKKKLMGAVKTPRQSTRLSRMQSSFSSSRSTLLTYLDIFREPMPPENVAKLAQIVGLSSPSQLCLPEIELQAILDELSVRAI
ncbi:hypothetical protein D1007_39742 [Hordeum vulgare]|nr:hypothetical protein D1007_39742 [Hordeum vulgare]